MTTSAIGKQPRKAATETGGPLSADELKKMNAYWGSANYLSVGQIYLSGPAAPMEICVGATVRSAEITCNPLALRFDLARSGQFC